MKHFKQYHARIRITFKMVSIAEPRIDKSMVRVEMGKPVRRLIALVQAVDDGDLD